MVFVACGLNHKTAPLQAREKFALNSAEQLTLLQALLEHPKITEAVILTTCNRTELYCETLDPTLIQPWLCHYYQLPPEQVLPSLYLYQDQAAVKHLLHVATGLDSMMIGESQIFGQLKKAYQSAHDHGMVGRQLHTLFQSIFRASKRIRHQSHLGHHAISVAYAGAQLVQKHCPIHANHDRRILLIGSGETASLVAKYLYQQGPSQWMVASRTLEHSTTLAHRYHGSVVPIQDIAYRLSEVDIVISATTCPLPFITETMVKHALEQRSNAPMLFLDLAVPRDIEPLVKQIPFVHLYNIDDLETLTRHGMEERQHAAQEAQALIELELKRFKQHHQALRAKNLICYYRQTMQELADVELQRAFQQLAKGHHQDKVLSEFSQRLINKLAHLPTIGLRQAALNDHNELLDLAHDLFNPTQMAYEDIS